MKLKLSLLIVLFTLTSQMVFAQLEWVKYEGLMPANVVIGGQENGDNLCVCRVFYNEVNHAGKVVGGNCNIGLNGEELVFQEFDVLVNKGGIRLTWQPVRRFIPANAVVAGTSDEKRIAIGQADRAEDNSVHPGEVTDDNGYFSCHYGYGGAEITAKTNYRILVSEPALEWIPFDGTIPVNVVNGGRENGNNLPVCRAEYNGALHPGKLVGSNCNIGWGGKEIELPTLEILINGGQLVKWVTVKGSIPEGAVEAGVENGNPLYVGQFTRPDRSVHSGKIFGTPGAYIFNYGYGGKEITEKVNFRILVEQEPDK